jgi:flavin-dependent dehydrogenase
MPELRDSYETIVVGGGPAGTTFGHLMKRSGHDVLLVEHGSHPRFCVGESLLPATTSVWRELGLVERFEKAGFVRKFGAYFSFAEGGPVEYIHFPDARDAVSPHAYEVPRARFDQLLWEAALEAGVHGVENTEVRGIVFDGDRAIGVDLRLPDGSVRRVHARLITDCSGRATLLARQLALRERDPRLDTVALYSHYADPILSTGEDAGTIGIIATDFGWMWFIPFAGNAASVGAVLRRSIYTDMRKASRDREALWSRILEEVPAVSARLRGAVQSRPVSVTADFQYRSRQLAGDGWVMVGDAGAFLDPVFSSGVHLAMTGAQRASRVAAKALSRGRLPRARDFAGYARVTRRELRAYSRYICAWYEPDFREVFMRPPHGKPGVEWITREILPVLTGNVSRPWRARLPVHILRALARLKRWGDERAAQDS